MKITILEIFKKSIYSPEFYKGLPSEPFSFSLKYFLKLSTILALVVTIIVSFELIPRLNFFL